MHSDSLRNLNGRDGEIRSSRFFGRNQFRAAGPSTARRGSRDLPRKINLIRILSSGGRTGDPPATKRPSRWRRKRDPTPRSRRFRDDPRSHGGSAT